MASKSTHLTLLKLSIALILAAWSCVWILKPTQLWKRSWHKAEDWADSTFLGEPGACCEITNSSPSMTSLLYLLCCSLLLRSQCDCLLFPSSGCGCTWIYLSSSAMCEGGQDQVQAYIRIFDHLLPVIVYVYADHNFITGKKHLSSPTFRIQSSLKVR